MIAKLVTHAKTREQAIDAQADALDAFTIEGIRHNIPFLAAIMQRPRWRSGKLSTAFIAEEFPGGFERPRPTGAVARTLAGVAAAIDHVMGERKRRISGQSNSAVTRERRRAIWLGADEIHADVVREGDAITVLFEDGNSHVLDLEMDSRHAGLGWLARWHRRGGACAYDPQRLRACAPRR